MFDFHAAILDNLEPGRDGARGQEHVLALRAYVNQPETTDAEQ